MNAEVITKDIMREITAEGAISDKAFRRIEYAISRAVGSIISGLTPTDQPQPDQSETRQHEAWGWQRRDSFKNFTHKLTSYGVDPTPENYSEALIAFSTHVRLISEQSAKRGVSVADEPQVSQGRGVPTEQYTEGAPRKDAASLPNTTACCAGCPISKYEFRIAELESLLRTRTKQVSIALAIRDLHRKFDRECQEHPL